MMSMSSRPGLGAGGIMQWTGRDRRHMEHEKPRNHKEKVGINAKV